MFATNVILTVKNAADIEKVGELLRRMGQLSREEPGCLLYDVCHSLADPSVYLLIERWESKEIWEVHRQAEGYITIYQPQVLPLVDRIPHPSEILE